MFKGKATGGAPKTESAMTLKAIKAIGEPGGVMALRVLPGGRSCVGKVDDPVELLWFVEKQDDYSGIYYTLNPVRHDLDGNAKKADILHRRWLLVDIDPVRPSDVSATNDEHEVARQLATRITGELMGMGWPLPLTIDSGNGWHLLYRIDLPNDELSRVLVKGVLAGIAERFDTDKAKVDRVTHDAPRIAKLPGTWARKGPNTKERPHRLCKIIGDMGGKIVVTVEQLQKLAKVAEPKAEPRNEPPPSPPPPPPPDTSIPFRGRAKGEAWTAYASAALESELNRIKRAATGERNNVLNVAAFCLGQFVPGGHLIRSDLEAALMAAALSAGLTEAESRSTIKSGLDAGAKLPRAMPEPSRNGASQKSAPQRPPIDPNVPLTIKMSKVKPLMVEWLMPNRIPKRFITVLAGQTGIGKSFVSCDLVARISRGGEIPFSGGKCFPIGGTLIISEDSHEYVLAPRLIDAGANMDRIHAMTWAAMGQYHLSDVEMLEKAAAEVEGGVSVVMIDPPTNFLEGTDEHKNSEVRQLVMKIVEWALGRDVAVLFILHVNKNAKGVDALNRVMGSVAWVTTARIAHSFCHDPDDRERGLMAPLKNNLGPIGKAIAYKIVKKDGGTVVEWIEEVDTTANAAMAQEPSEKRRRVKATVFLEEMFAGRPEVPSGEIWKAQEKTNVSRNALLEAKDEMGITARQHYETDGSQRWIWRWPDEARANWNQKKSQTEMSGKTGKNGPATTQNPDQNPKTEFWDSGSVKF